MIVIINFPNAEILISDYKRHVSVESFFNEFRVIFTGTRNVFSPHVLCE